MISQTAIDSLDELIAKGLTPTPRDIIRLNAVGVKLEAATAQRATDSTYLLPRVAAVTKDLWFRQPTIGHEIWMEKVERFIADGDYQSLLAIRAYALSRSPEKLPDPDDPGTIKTAVDEFVATCKNLTRDQILAAVRYATLGADHTAGETTAHPSGEKEEEENPDFTDCIAIGVLNEGRAVLWGISEADMLRMTTQQLADVIDRAKIYHKIESGGDEDFWQGRYYATLDEITSRLTREKESANGRPTSQV